MELFLYLMTNLSQQLMLWYSARVQGVTALNFGLEIYQCYALANFVYSFMP